MIHKILFAISFVLIVPTSQVTAAEDGLHEVNARRASKGLKPFIRDEALSQAAAAAADFRAARLVAGHTANDFAYVPSGAKADSAGCAAWTPDLGWGSCCSDDKEYTYAGAAWTMGRDGRRYMHLYVSYRPNGVPASSFSWQKAPTGWWLRKGGKSVGFLHTDRNFQWRREDGTFSDAQVLEPGGFPKPE